MVIIRNVVEVDQAPDEIVLYAQLLLEATAGSVMSLGRSCEDAE